MPQVSVDHLNSLLASDDPKVVMETLAEYFEPSSVASPTLTLSNDVELVFSQASLETARVAMGVEAAGIGDIIGWMKDRLVNAANNWKRKSRFKLFRKRMKENPAPSVVVSEGDSWFQHPLIMDAIDHLIEDPAFTPGMAIMSLGAAAADLWEYMKDKEYLKYARLYGAKALLLSGGGNDILGDEFPNYLNAYTPAPPGQNPDRFINDATFRPKLQQLKRYYEEIIKDCKGVPTLKGVVGHTYAYAAQKTGKGLTTKMADERGITNRDDQKALVKRMVDRFHDELLQPLAAAHAGYFDYADVRDDILLVDDWHDEIHPDAEGAFHVAFELHQKVRPLL